MAVRDEFEAILRSEDRIHGIARGSRDGHFDKLSIGIVSSVAPMRFARFVRRALEQLPMSEMVLHPISRGSGMQLVLAGTLDGCIIGEMPERNAKLDAVPLFTERLLLGCGAEHRFAQMDIVSPGELAQETYIDRLNCEFRDRVTSFLQANGNLPTARLRSEREDWLQEVVAAGGGICMLPEHSRISSGVILRPVEGLELAREITFVSVSGSGNSKVLLDFRRLLVREKWDD